jgi:hypothetical protein
MAESVQKQSSGKGNCPLPNANNPMSVVTIDEYLKDFQGQVKYVLFGGFQNYSIFSKLFSARLGRLEKYPSSGPEVDSFIRNSISDLVDYKRAYYMDSPSFKRLQSTFNAPQKDF